MPDRQRVQPVLACARCYSLKKKCDKKLPSCSRCILAGKECVGINRHSRKKVPRSVLQYLEKRLAVIEHNQRARTEPPYIQQTETEEAAFKTSKVPRHIYAQTLQTISISIRSLYTTSCVGSHPGLLHESKLFYPTERPPHKVPVHGLYYQDLGKRAGHDNESHFSGLDPLRIPFEVARHIFDNYVNTILPRYPCFTSGELWYHFGQVYSRQQPNNSSLLDVSHFIVSIVLAVSCLTSRREDFSNVASMSESLYRDAMRHWTFLKHSNIQSLQGLLLLIQLGFLLPYINNVYYLGSEAVYLIDRTVAISTGSPPCVSDEHITTCLPGDGGEWSHITGILPSYSDMSLNTKLFLSQIHLCRLQSEIYEIKFFDRAIPDHFASHSDWVQSIEERITSMLNLSVSSNGIVPQWIVNAAHLSQNLLHRPYPGNTAPSHTSLMAATTSAISLINGYHKPFPSTRLTWTFVVVNNVFQAAIVLLYIFRNYGYVVREASLEDELRSAFNNFMAILDTEAQRWPVIAITRLYMKDLQNVVFSNQLGSVDSENDSKLLGELELLLSQRRIRSIYQANTELEHALLSAEPSSSLEDSQQPFSDDMWQDFIGTQFDFEEVYSFNFLDSSWLDQQQQQQQTPLTSTVDATNEIPTPELPKDIKDIIDSLPSCSFCRNQHIRCDLAPQPQSMPSASILASQPASQARSRLTWGINLLIPAMTTSKLGSGESQDAPNSSIRTANPDYSFFGVSSHLASINSVMLPLAEHTPATIGREPSARMVTDSITSTAQVNRPDISIALRLFAVFYRSVHVWYPVMNDNCLQGLLSYCYTEPLDSCLDHNQELFYLILAISSQLTKRAEHGVSFTPSAYFEKATSHVNTSCDHSSGSSTLHMMQRSLLICIYLLLSPGGGDVWRNLGFAIRLYFDMSHGRFENINGLDEGHLTMLARTLYCVEGKITTAFGRPTVLITGDKLRDELTRPICTTTEERVSIQFYRISTMKMQLQSLLLSEASSMQRNPKTLNERCENIRKELLQWHQSWETEFIPTITSELHDWRGAVQYLQAWGSLQYNETILMLSRLLSETTDYVFNAVREVVSCCSLLVREHQHSFCAIHDPEMRHRVPVFPIDWTTSHLLFSAALQLLCSEKREVADHNVRERTIRSCLTTIALMEADPANLSTGFSAILEGLYCHDDKHI
ncbi:Oleate activated transcription factor 3 [Talaromyces islandicus]|uniref:Oleate activated transcription factor 3 n=1 Tax=Talaromyces islandicus TaxID=28573 RepID=A0A0U1M090_TALIS|nr:Oleate activated transcription factor 3 [Talaromyces islandicus]